MKTMSVLRILLVAEAFSSCALAGPAGMGGTGEPDDPYQIATAQQLIAVGQDPNRHRSGPEPAWWTGIHLQHHRPPGDIPELLCWNLRRQRPRDPQSCDDGSHRRRRSLQIHRGGRGSEEPGYREHKPQRRWRGPDCKVFRYRVSVPFDR